MPDISPLHPAITEISHRRFLITGARGILGSALTAQLQDAGEEVVAVDITEADLSVESVARQLVETVHPAIVFNCAAYTNVDGAESNREACHAVNVLAPGYLARACDPLGALIVHIGTDFVFNGARPGRPFREDDPVDPHGYYAQTKYDGERSVADVAERFLIVRTAWLFGPGRHNFVSAIHGQLDKGAPLRVVDDQVGSPTYSIDLADRLIHMADSGLTGLFHLTNDGWCSRFEFAREIVRAAGRDPEIVQPIKTHQRPAPAPRPAWSVLDCSKALAAGVPPMRPWQEAVGEYVACLIAREGET